MTAVLCQHVNFNRGTRRVLTDVSFSVNAGELVALIGHNGAGKSTLIKLILGLLTPASGELTVFGRSPGSEPLKVGYLPENVMFYGDMTFKEHLDFFAALKNVGEKRVEALIETLGLESVRDQKVNCSSKGQRQRLGLAQAILSKPRLLLLDEPTVGLDPQTSAFMYRELKNLNREGCAIMVCTHELLLAEAYMDRAVMIHAGQKVADGTAVEIVAQGHIGNRIRSQGETPNLLNIYCALAQEKSQGGHHDRA